MKTLILATIIAVLSFSSVGYGEESECICETCTCGTGGGNYTTYRCGNKCGMGYDGDKQESEFFFLGKVSKEWTVKEWENRYRTLKLEQQISELGKKVDQFFNSGNAIKMTMVLEDNFQAEFDKLKAEVEALKSDIVGLKDKIVHGHPATTPYHWTFDPPLIYP